PAGELFAHECLPPRLVEPPAGGVASVGNAVFRHGRQGVEVPAGAGDVLATGAANPPVVVAEFVHGVNQSGDGTGLGQQSAVAFPRAAPALRVGAGVVRAGLEQVVTHHSLSLGCAARGRRGGGYLIAFAAAARRAAVSLVLLTVTRS